MLITDIKVTPKGAIHVGAHKGEERAWYRSRGFNKVLWFEPNTGVFQSLQDNIKDYKGHAAINKGLSHDMRTAKLNIANNTQCSSTLELGLHKDYYPGVHYTHSQIIELIRGDEIPDLQDYNFLNIDVQGNELSVIKSFGSQIKLFDYIYTEVNMKEVYKKCALVDEINSYLLTYGFACTRLKETINSWGDALYEKT